MISTSTRNILIAAVLTSAALIATCGTSYVGAQHTGEESEKALAAATAAEKTTATALAEQLIPVTGMVALAEMPPVTVLKFAKRWRPTSLRYTLQDGSPEKMQEFQLDLRRKTITAEKAHISAENAKRNYQALLGSRWTGFWLRANGYPKTPLKP